LDYEVLQGGVRVFIDGSVRFGLDALILSRFAVTKRTQKVLDLGTGCGILCLSALDRNLGELFVGVDIDDQAVLLARRGAREYAAAHEKAKSFTVVHEDLKTFSHPFKFDVVVCNPPYYTPQSGILPRDILTRAARYELRCTIADVASAARRNLKQGGSLCISYRPARLADAVAAMRDNRLEPKRMRFARKDPQTEPWLVLIDARLDAGVGLTVEPDLITLGESGGFSQEIAAIMGTP